MGRLHAADGIWGTKASVSMIFSGEGWGVILGDSAGDGGPEIEGMQEIATKVRVDTKVTIRETLLFITHPSIS